MPLTCDIAGDVAGMKRNLRVEFMAPPTVHDVTRAAESLFTVLLQSAAAEAGADDLPRGNRSDAPYQRISELFFAVESIAVRDEGRGAWVRVESGSQLRTGNQLYCFQPVQRVYKPLSVTRHAQSSSLTELVPSSAAAAVGKEPAKAGALTVDALLVEERDVDGPGLIPPPERVVLWGRDTAAIFCSGDARRLPRDGMHDGATRGGGGMSPQQSAHKSRGAEAAGMTDREGNNTEGGKEKRTRGPLPMFLRETASSVRRARAQRESPSPPPASSPHAAARSGSGGASQPQSESDGIRFVSHRRLQRQPDAAAAEQGGTLRDIPSLAAPKEAAAWRATEQPQQQRRPPPSLGQTHLQRLASLSPSPLPIPRAVLSAHDEAPQVHRPSAVSAPPPAAASSRAARVGFHDRVRLTFDAMRTESYRPFLLLRDLFAFAKSHAVLSRESLARDAAIGSTFAGESRSRSASPFFTDRLRDDHELTLEGVLRDADTDRDGCVGYGEWVGFCLANPAVLELLFLFLQHGGPAEGIATPATASPLGAGRGGGHQDPARLFRAAGEAGGVVPWERRHLLPARSGPPRCEACVEIDKRWTWRLGQPRPHEGRRREGEGGKRSTPSPARAAHADRSPPPRIVEWAGPYPTAMPPDDFARRVRMMGIHDKLKK